MRILRSLAFGFLAAGGAYCVGFVACRLGQELFAWAAPVFDALLPVWVAVASITAGLFGYYSRSPRLRSLVLATTFIVTLTGFYAVTVRLVDEHHDSAFRKRQETWHALFKVYQRNTFRKHRCELYLLQERFAMTGELALNDAAATRRYCSRWGGAFESVHEPIEDLWEIDDEQDYYPVRGGNDDV